MADTYVIVRVYPYAEKDPGEVPEATLDAFKTSRGCVIPREQPSKRQSASRRERQSTEPLEAQNVPVLDTLPYVELRLSDTPGFRSGFVFSWGPNSDVVLPDNRGVGYHHFSLTFDDKKRPIVKDWGSLNASPAYIEKVDRFFQNAPATEDLLSSLDIASRPVTERPTGTHTPDTGPIHLPPERSMPLKEPSEEAHRRGRVRINAWRNEAHIMNLISHPHVVKLLKSDFTQGPRLHLEYVPCGSLANQRNISAAECVSILQQCLSALEYLHGSDPPIVHRDIKANNVLVQYRDSDGIYVKFGDFGLARDYDNMSTICGNFAHLAPEVYQNHQYIQDGGKGRVSYTEAVDIWSLGVVVYELRCPLPQFETQYISSGTAWPKKLINMFKKDFEEWPDELRRFLLDAMVVLLPEQRWSAGDCFAEAALLSAPAMDQSETAVAVSYVSDDERSTIRYKAEPSMAQGLERQPGSSEYSTLSTDAGRYDRSGAPTPRASVTASAFSRERATASTSSSSGRHRKRREHGSSSSKADTASRQQRDRILNNRT
ncbi:CAMK protein kinase [Gaeumannomyces tritici R3-111a-1]|uniref:non-specific serine/threonine protein kinase n=1 Tax=Gaeumannomyces tritici (strain R3-111a-1) TaxID=644352 RepID=J3PIT6_GAET3|nr:CAMK protein kinase [Gaeumannomyces tritici R3-111a-1]EJT69019.1 CAMK protein kinase [Gaeumannomyces tritici R3-111a-1]